MSSQFTIPIKFGPDGCQVNLGDRICRETETLAIIQEFNRTYQAKLREIGNIGGGDNLQRRVNLQQDWIRDLTQQNEMLVKIVESLEKEAADKVALLAKKLETSTLSSEKRIRLLESDVRSLVEVIKRARDENRWSANGLKFFTVNPDTFLLKCECSLIPPTPPERQDNVSLKITDSLHRRVKKGSDSKLRVILEVVEQKTNDL
uniref:Uncharacterized protein n=1 Tax=Photinus pyralis TaxID=7054 RepID=A0A1Y1MZS5_PHOPY